jgi:hypothetical protein
MDKGFLLAYSSDRKNECAIVIDSSKFDIVDGFGKNILCFEMSKETLTQQILKLQELEKTMK